jgi:hypothetical protein
MYWLSCSRRRSPRAGRSRRRDRSRARAGICVGRDTQQSPRAPAPTRSVRGAPACEREAIERIVAALDQALLLEVAEQGAADAQRLVRGMVADLADPSGRRRQAASAHRAASPRAQGVIEDSATSPPHCLERAALAPVLAGGRGFDLLPGRLTDGKPASRHLRIASSRVSGRCIRRSCAAAAPRRRRPRR